MPEFFDPAQAAVYLGETRNTVYRLIADGRISYLKGGPNGGRYKFTREQLDAYLASTVVETRVPLTPAPRAPRPRPFVPDGRHRIRLPSDN